jgi:hypothetical protein
MKRDEFFRLLEEATEVRSDRGWYLVRLPGEAWRLYHLAPLEAHRPGAPTPQVNLLAEGEEALDRARALGLSGAPTPQMNRWRGAA